MGLLLACSGHLIARCQTVDINLKPSCDMIFGLRAECLTSVQSQLKKIGKVVRTTVSDSKALCPMDRVNRQFRAERPNQLWVSDFT